MSQSPSTRSWFTSVKAKVPSGSSPSPTPAGWRCFTIALHFHFQCLNSCTAEHEAYLLLFTAKLHSCMPSSEADPAPQHLSQFIPRQFFNLLPCSTNYTAVCHLQRQIPFLSICHSSCHINFLSLAVQHKLHIQLYATFRGRPHSSASVTVHATSTFYLLLCSTNCTAICHLQRQI